jgi:hypothetical protein
MRSGLVLILALAACGSAGGGNDSGANVANAAANQSAEAPPSMAPPADTRAAGRYRLAGSPDEVVQIELMADGRFRMAMMAGAVDARSEGRWTSDGRSVLLNTWPRPRAPEFRADAVTRGGEAPWTILVKGPDGQGLAGVDLNVTLADGSQVDSYTQYYGWRSDQEPRAVEISLAMYNIPPRRFTLDPRQGNVFNFTLVPNDFGVIDFRDERFEISGRDLISNRNGRQSTFRREG